MNNDQRNTDTRELMIRLDERMKGITLQLTLIQTTIDNKVSNDQEYKEMIIKVDKMWDLKNKALGYIAAWSAGIAIFVAILVNTLSQVVKSWLPK